MYLKKKKKKKKKIVIARRRDLKLIVTSATMNSKQVIKLFNKISLIQIIKRNRIYT